MEKPAEDRLKLLILLFGVFTTSFGVLAFEISLTRIFSVIFSYHYVFLAVSLALMGLGLGGVLTQAISNRIPMNKAFSALSIMALTFSLTTSIFTFTIVSNSSSSIIGDAFIMFLPFLIAGSLLAAVYKTYAGLSNAIYFADLLGAAAGALAIVFLLNTFGAVKAVLLISTLIAVASLFFALASKRKTVVLIAVAGVIIAGFFAQYSYRIDLLDIPMNGGQEKELADILADPSLGARIVDSRWSAFGRTDLVELDADPHAKLIFVDGGAGTRMFHFDGDFNGNNDVPSLRYTTQFFPYYLANKGSALVIGPGGGLDVLTSMMGGMNHTTAVEVNPDIVSIVRDYSEYNGGIYERYGNVHVSVDEGRSFVRRSDQKFDIIMLDIPVTKTSQGTIGYALAENYLFTTNSFTDFLDHLNDEGLLTVIAHGSPEVYRLVSIAFKILGDRGLSAQEIMRRIVVIEGADHSSFPVFILKKTPFAYGVATEIYEVSNGLGLRSAYIPYVDGSSFDPFLKALADGRVTMAYAASLIPFDIRPPTDDDPFFYKFEKGLPLALSQLVGGTVVIGVVSSGLYLAGWMRRPAHGKKNRSHSFVNKPSLFRLYYFASLGLGFMLIEMPLIQRFILFLGHPTLAIAASLFSLLLASGLGGLYGRRWGDHEQHDIFKISLIIGIMAIFYPLILPYFFNIYLSSDMISRLILSFALMFPLGFLMGIPFPTGLRLLGNPGDDVAWMWCVNGVFSLLGSTLALALAMSFGFTAALLLGGLTYIGVFLVGRGHAIPLKRQQSHG